ncbi:NADPH-dependent diflavin oxidoreductase 1 [Parasteatoda tepidariorum]|uniref:NADPH-dependent diflavin oxidoreductase 1 n=1 Tax=Parasteatoda tepidariorum TaxID=114398 RepID=UPI001C720619|nr:NADPH-dependent diflavin oxidoreductase 1-like [Parasteatoda tepidariorum]
MNSSKISILFGTQTGNSEDVAERLGRLLTRMRLKPFVRDIQNYRISRLLEEKMVIFICSTTGNGEFPDNMKAFWKFLLRKNHPTSSLCHLKFCVFGLGDSSYEKFNVVAKKLNKRLLQLGATEVLPIALGDDQHELGYDAALDPWLKKLKDIFSSYYDINASYIPDDTPLPPKFKVKFLEKNGNIHFNNDCMMQNYQQATLKSIKKETSDDHFQTVNLVSFMISPEVVYEPGDVAVVWPENPPHEVNEFLSLLKVPFDDPFIIVPADQDTPPPPLTPYPCTVRECVKKYFDVLSIPRRSFFEFFYHFSQDETEKEKLLEFTTAEGQEELYEYCNRPRRNILEVLLDFPHTTPHVPFEYFFDMIPAIRPRSYSIASALSVHSCEFQLLVAVVNYKTRLQKTRKGLCSNWLSNLPEGSKIPFYTKKGSIALPGSMDPIVMIGPGTGCAPFKAFVEHRAHKKIGDNHLFFGCRYKEKDFLCSESWKELEEKDMLTLFTAFSRDQEDKVYVQHKIVENSTLLWELINHKLAYVYIAGNAKQMPEGVKDAFLKVFEKEGYLSNNECIKYLKTMELHKRYQVETWC